MSNAGVIHAQMINLVERAGGVEAAARLIDARMGRPLDRDAQSTRKGTLSKRLSGVLSWPLDEIMALQEVLGLYPVTDWMIMNRPARDQSCLMGLVGDAAREHGEAMAAALAVVSGSGKPERAKAEIVEAIGTLQQMLAQLGGGE